MAKSIGGEVAALTKRLHEMAGLTEQLKKELLIMHEHLRRQRERLAEARARNACASSDAGDPVDLKAYIQRRKKKPA